RPRERAGGQALRRDYFFADAAVFDDAGVAPALAGAGGGAVAAAGGAVAGAGAGAVAAGGDFPAGAPAGAGAGAGAASAGACSSASGARSHLSTLPEPWVS